jgi:hypothetical protein
MDQATSAHQGVLRHFAQRRQDPSLDRSDGYVLIAIVRKRLRSDASLYELLQILSVTLFEQTTLECVLARSDSQHGEDPFAKQLILFAD